MLKVRPYTTFLDLPKGANIFWIALTGLIYETIDTEQQRKFKTSSLRNLARYTDKKSKDYGPTYIQTFTKLLY